MSEASEPKRLCLSKTDLNELTKDELVSHWNEQERYLDLLEAKANERIKENSELVSLRESEEKLKQQQVEATRRENVLVMRLTTKEQEMQEYANQIQELKQAQVPGTSQLRSTLVDPAVNLMFERMKKGLDSTKAKLEETQNDLSAWKFTPDSNTGKRLMAKCRLLHQENEELGKMISSGRIAKLEGDLALQRNFSEEMKKSQADLEEFLMELDEDVEGMQSTIYYLQQQLRETKDLVAKLQQENQRLRVTAAVVAIEEDEEAVKVNDLSLTPPPKSNPNDTPSRNPLSPLSLTHDDISEETGRNNYEDDVEMLSIEELNQSDLKSKVPFDAENDNNSMETTVLPVVDDLMENSTSPRSKLTELTENSKSPRTPLSKDCVDNLASLTPTSKEFPDDSNSRRPSSTGYSENSKSPSRLSTEFPENSMSPGPTSPEQPVDVVERYLDSSPVLEIDMDASPSECETDVEQKATLTPSPPLRLRTSRDDEEAMEDVEENKVDETTENLEGKVKDGPLTNSSEPREHLEVENEDFEVGDNELVIDCPQPAVNGNGCSVDNDEDEPVASEHSDSESRSESSTEDDSRQTLTPSPRTPETPPPRDSYTPPRDSNTPPMNSYTPPRDSNTSPRNSYTPPLPVKVITDSSSVHLDGETKCTKAVISRDEISEFVVMETKKSSLNGISDSSSFTSAPN